MRDLLGRAENVGFMRYGKKLKTARKMLHSEFNPLQVSKWDLLLEDGVSSLMNDLGSNTPNAEQNPRNMLRR